MTTKQSSIACSATSTRRSRWEWSSSQRKTSLSLSSYGVHADGKSHTGVYITLGRGGVFFRSTKQKIVTKSSTESELVGLSDSLSQAIWTREFLIGQGYKVGPAKVFQDNMSTITLAAKGSSTSDRTRHIHIRCFFVKDRVTSIMIITRYMLCMNAPYAWRK